MAQGIITKNENGIYYLATLVQPWGTIEKIYYDYLLNGKFWTNYLLKEQHRVPRPVHLQVFFQLKAVQR